MHIFGQRDESCTGTELFYVTYFKCKGLRGSTYLNKDSKEDDGDNGGEEHLSHREMVAIQQKAQGESNGASETTVGYYKLIFGGQLYDAELIYDVSQTNNTCDE